MSISIVSYAQNNEDVMLWRALRDVDHGFYIDVGAQDPMIDSVTKAFYECGWHGINIEPVKHWFDRLVKDRPHDINLQVATSDRAGELALFEVEGSGLSTTNAAFAERHRAQGFVVNRSVVPCVTLDAICRDHHVGTVHFLKVDCEGAEKRTLEGISLADVRPWIIVVEATEPNSQKATHEEWEYLLLQRAYEFVYFDGLNRFYVAAEHPSLRNAFGMPPNVFDGVSRYELLKARASVDELSQQLDQMGTVQRNAVLEADLARIREELLKTQSSARTREARIAELQTTCDQSAAEVTGLREKLRRTRRTWKESQASIVACKAHIVHLRTELRQTRVICGLADNAPVGVEADASQSVDGSAATVARPLAGARGSVPGSSAPTNDDTAALAVEKKGDPEASGTATMEEVMSRVRAEVERQRDLQSETPSDPAVDAGVCQQGARWHPAEPRLEPRTSYHLAELVRFDDADFVHTAYRVLLRRMPDRVGYDHYLDALRSGLISKIEILGLMRFSDEGRKCGVRVDGLLPRYTLHRWRRRRLIGPPIGFVMAFFRLPRLALRLQAMEASAARESHELGVALNRLDADVQVLRRDLNQSTLARVDALRALARWVEAVQDLAERPAAQPDDQGTDT